MTNSKDSLIEKIATLENEGINVTIGASANFFQKEKYGIMLHWKSPHHWTSQMPAGCLGESTEFSDYANFTEVFETTVAKLKEKITEFLGGAAI